jgi:arabinan endo-1,5-alpha-L-arabinosidase
MVKQDDTYYLFFSGAGIPIRRSKDMINWESAGQVFEEGKPQWMRDMLPEISKKDDLGAPDISYYNGQYLIYYHSYIFASCKSVMGLVVNRTLHPDDPEYEWVDRGLVLNSTPALDGIVNSGCGLFDLGNVFDLNQMKLIFRCLASLVLCPDYNTIDANFHVDAEGVPWLIFGSAWGGINMVEIDPATLKPVSSSSSDFIKIAKRPLIPTSKNPPVIEAPFVIRRNGLYYLFVSYDMCCAGVKSTYNIRVGRAEEVTGPYDDKEGRDLLKSGGSMVLQELEHWSGPGHNAVFSENGQDWLVHHAYDANDEGRPKLHIRKLHWDAEGWPTVCE